MALQFFAQFHWKMKDFSITLKDGALLHAIWIEKGHTPLIIVPGMLTTSSDYVSLAQSIQILTRNEQDGVDHGSKRTRQIPHGSSDSTIDFHHGRYHDAACNGCV
jgi:hypothetical protein